MAQATEALNAQLKRLSSPSVLIAQQAVIGVFAVLGSGSGASVTPAQREAAIASCLNSSVQVGLNSLYASPQIEDVNLV